MSETKTPVCPKCGADRMPDTPSMYLCGSFQRREASKFGDFYQSDKCRIREVEQENARLKDAHEKTKQLVYAYEKTIKQLESALAAERERVAKALEACVKEIQEQHKSHVAWECDSDETIRTIRRHFAAFDNSSGPG